jgi:hypothetical protein
MVLSGANAAAYVADIRAAFEPNLEPGMRRIADMMARAVALSPHPSPSRSNPNGSGG